MNAARPSAAGGEWNHEVHEEHEEEDAGEDLLGFDGSEQAALLMWFQMGYDRCVPLALPVLNRTKDAALAEPVAPMDTGNPLRLTADR